MRKQFAIFIVRWAMNSVALWVALRILSGSDFVQNASGISAFLVAGLILSLVNTFIKPIVIVLSLPAILLTMGLFMLIVNGLMVYIALALAPNMNITFVGAIIAGMVVSLTNYILSAILELRNPGRSTT
jgi:putative membrane protein